MHRLRRKYSFDEGCGLRSLGEQQIKDVKQRETMATAIPKRLTIIREEAYFVPQEYTSRFQEELET